jgi:tetratricopeptide (TPR) repeat protein
MPIYPMSSLKKLLSLVTLGLSLLISASVQADDIQDINQMFRKGDLNGALSRANQSLAKNPKDAQVRFLKGLILADQNKTSEAIQVFTTITDDYPELPEPYNNLAVLYASQGKYDAAKNALEMAIRTHPSYATAHENLGDLYAKMATQAYDKALQIDSSNKTAQTKLSLIKEMMSGQPRRPAPATTTAKQQATQPPAPASTVAVVVNKPEAPGKTEPAAAASPADIVETVQAWAKAWSDKNVETYIAHYSPDFSPSGMSYADWAAQRRERVGGAGRISVIARDIQVQRVSSNRATVRFKQIYQSDRLKNSSSKTLDMELADGKWRILRESGR